MKLKYSNRPLLALFAAGAFGTVSASGALVVYEPFADSQATLSGNSNSAPGFGLSGTWIQSTAAWDVLSGSLSWGTLATAGNQVRMDTGGNGTSGSNTTFGTSINGAGLLAHSATLWFSMIFTTAPVVSGNPDSGFAIGTASLNGSNNIPMSSTGNGIGFTVKNGDFQATTWAAGNAGRVDDANGGHPAAGSTTYFVVGEILWGANAGANDTINLYFPDTSLALGAVRATRSAILDQSGFSVLSFTHKADSSPEFIDEIRFGSSYADVSPVVPEPSAALLGGIGCLMLLRRRR